MTLPASTLAQLSELSLKAGQPLLAVDADEVLVHFICHFDRYVSAGGWRLDVTQYSLDGALSEVATGRTLSLKESLDLIDAFFEAETLNQTMIPDAGQVLSGLSEDFQIIVLTNIPHVAKPAREENLASMGMSYPVVTNTGGKGPALRWLSKTVAAPVVFVDDSPHQIASAHRDAPMVECIQFIGCPTAQRLIPASDAPALDAPTTWRELGPLIHSVAFTSR
jgi:hypothetical protein